MISHAVAIDFLENELIPFDDIYYGSNYHFEKMQELSEEEQLNYLNGSLEKLEYLKRKASFLITYIEFDVNFFSDEEKEDLKHYGDFSDLEQLFRSAILSIEAKKSLPHSEITKGFSDITTYARSPKETNPTPQESEQKRRLIKLFKLLQNDFHTASQADMAQAINFLMGKNYRKKKLAENIGVANNYEEDFYDDMILKLEKAITQLRTERNNPAIFTPRTKI